MDISVRPLASTSASTDIVITLRVSVVDGLVFVLVVMGVASDASIPTSNLSNDYGTHWCWWFFSDSSDPIVPSNGVVW
jgi:hypothetical protein